MDNARFVLIAFFFFLSVMLYQQWQIDYGPKPAVAPGLEATPRPDLPAARAPGGSGSAQSAEAPDTLSGQRIRVETDVLRLEVDTEGGDIRLLDLIRYPETKDHPDQPVRLFTEGDLRFIAQSGFIGESLTLPNHHTLWQGEQTDYRLTEGQNLLRIPLHWRTSEGV